MIRSVGTIRRLADGTPELVRRWMPRSSAWASVVLVHGLGEHSGRYERTGGLLAEAGLAVEAFDLVGFGGTGGRRGDIESWDTYLEQVHDHLTTVDSPAVLLGHSMGGLIALDYLLSGRPRPDLAVLSAPGLGGGKAWQRKVAPLLARLAPTAAIPTKIDGSQLSRDPAVGEAYFADPLVLTRVSARLGAELFGAIDRVLAGLDRLEVPTLVLHGGADTLVPPQASLPLAKVPCVERRVYPKLRHELFNEPEGPEVVGDVVAWIEERLRRRP